MAELDPDSEIRTLLQQLKGTDKEPRAYDELQRHRAEAKFLAYLHEKVEAERTIEEARQALRERLRKLLG